jgi:hypothetical protein
MTIEQLPKGCLPDPVDERDYKAEAVMGAPTVDWNTPFKLPNPGDEDQGSSLSCVSQGWSYYHTQLRPKNYSRRDLYSRIHLPGGAAFIRSGGLTLISKGQATRDEVPDPNPQTELAMQDKTGVTDEKSASDIEANSFLIEDRSIDGVAAAIKNYKGVVFGVVGSNPGWKDLANPRPPLSGEETWGHALYAYGYHLHDRQKCIIAKSSWCKTGILEHHIKENYFVSGNTFNAWTLIPKEQFMNQAKIVVSKNSPTVYICYPIPSEQHLKERTSLEGIQLPNPIPNSDAL